MSHHYLLLWLEGPLQSWGHDSRFGRRDTLPFPTQSGVCGILCAALGAGGLQRDLLAQLTSGKWFVRAMPRCNAQPTVPLCDFQMVGSGYDESDPWQLLLIPKTSEGKKAVGGGTKMTYRYYLQDSAFAVAIELPQVLANELSVALAAPVWELSLGRKTCVPSEFIGQGIFTSLDEAWERSDLLMEQKNRQLRFTVFPSALPEEGEVLTLNDVPLQFGEDKRYGDRLVTIVHP
ncbi:MULTISPECIES: type I-E CRISPR-associated protein Cas5/CasD [Enterobacterales]|uniref:type I-E CRISPR-associated protein Cas5/CasD n=1 Tax=Enterobacterales TaxID=91347 RepID=UPI002ED8C669